MNDATGFDSGAFWLAFVHPLWMIVSLSCGVLTLRAGLRLRSARRRGTRRGAADYHRHLRFAKPTLAMLWLGFFGGLASSLWLRGWELLATAHGWISVLALGLFTVTGVLGRRLELGQSREPERHGLLGLVAMLAAAAAFGTGLVLLP